MDIQLGYWRWKVYRWNEHPNPFRGRADLALEWLRRFRNDRLVMSELRATLNAATPNAQRWSDDNRILEEVAARLSCGEFYVCAESSYPFHTAAVDLTPADAPEPVVAAPPPPPAPAPKPATEPEPEPTLPQNADPASIAETLQQAAKTGTPFCEECEKAKAALAQAPPLQPAPPPESTLPDAADPVAIAQSLQTASRDGMPFCEECERARRAMSQN